MHSNFKFFFKNTKNYKYRINIFFYISLLKRIIKKENKDLNLNIKFLKKKSRNFILLKATFKHKVPKHVLRQNQSKLIVSISSNKNLYLNTNMENIVSFVSSAFNLKKNVSFIPGNMYRIKIDYPINVTNFLVF